MKVYRWLNPQGNGLYQDHFWMEAGLVFQGEFIPYFQPPLYEDVRGIKLELLDRYFCAFETFDQMMSWFRDIEPLNIFIAGGKLMEITIADEHVLKGSKQCIYRKFKSSEEREISVDEFIEHASTFESKWKDW